MSEINLRAATAADIPAVVAFWAAAAENAQRPVDGPEAVAALLARDPDALIIAESGKDLVGTIIAGWDGWRCHLYRLAVSPGHRRRGIGRVLIDAAEERLRRLGGGRVNAMVLDDNEVGRQTWQSSGYSRQANWSRWVKPMG